MKELIIDKQTINLYPRLTTKKTSSGIVFIYNSNELLKISRKYTCLLGLEKEEDIQSTISKLTDEMLEHASKMEFEQAAELRDKIKELEKLL